MDGTDQRRVSADGITVKKRIDTDQFKTPAVVLDIVSTADRSATVTLTEPIPEAFAIEDIGFHPEFGGEQWSIAGREITFQRETDPGEEYTTVYGVRGVEPDEIDVFLETGMSVAADYGDDFEESADEAEAEPVGELLEEDDDEVVRDVIAGDRDSLPEMGDEPAAPEGGHEGAADEAAEAGVANDRAVQASGDEDHGEEETVDGDGEDTAAEAASPDDGAVAGKAAPDEYRTLPGSVAEALAAEVRDGTIAEEHERVLREAFGGLEEEPSGSVDARIEHLQTQVADLAAYTDELERFLDEHGGGDSALADVEEGLADVTENVDALEEAVDALDDRVGETEGRLDEAETGIDDLLYLEEDVMELRTRTEDLPELEETVEQLSEERVADLDSRVGDLSETIDTLESEMEEMKSFRDRLSSAFGPGGGPPGGAGEE